MLENPRPTLMARLCAALRHLIELQSAPAFHLTWRILQSPSGEGAAGWRARAKSIVAAVWHPTLTPGIQPADAAGLTTLRSYATRSLQSKTGSIEADHVFCVPFVHRKEHCIFGGDHLICESGIYLAVFELEIIAYDFSSDPLVILDIYDNLQSKLVVAERTIDKADLAGSPRFFSLKFHGKAGQRMEFRAYWRGQSNLKAYGVVLQQRAISGGMDLERRPAHQSSATRKVESVSAIIPCYNGAPWLAEAISSIRAQTRGVDEIIVVDDCSTDGSYEIAEKHNAMVIRNASNLGEGSSRNVGLKYARGDWITWLDADDYWMPHHVQTLAALLERYSQATGAFGAVQQFGLRHKLIRGYVPLGEPSNVFWLAFCDWLHTTIGSMVSRSALLSVGGFDEQERYSVDFDLWLRLARSHLFVCTHEPTSYWRWHDRQQSVHQDKQIAAVYRFRRRYWEQERAQGDPSFAAELESCMCKVWHGDMTEAWKAGDDARFRLLFQLARLLPKAPSSMPPEWPARIGLLEDGMSLSEYLR